MKVFCDSCRTGIWGADVLYTADAQLVCPACFAKASLAAEAVEASALAAAPWIGALAAMLPWLLHTTVSVTVRGDVVRYRDWMAISGGGVAVACGIAAILHARARVSGRLLALGMAIALIGVYHLARGVGMIA
jgi:hypothetical protein